MMNSKQNVYYVYELIDPRNDTVFYVGLSNQFSEKAILNQDKYKRVKYHGIFRSKSWWNAYKTKKKYLSHKENIIRNCINEGLEIKFAIVKDFMSEQEAKELEMKLIKELGRADIEGGVLTNISIGGDHVNQHPKKYKRIALRLRKENSEKYKELDKQSSERLKKLWNNKDFANKKRLISSLSLKNRWKDEDERNFFKEVSKNTWIKNREKMSKEIKERWNREDYRNKCVKNLNHSHEHTSNISKKFHEENPGFNKEYLIAYNKSEKGRNESRRRAEHMRNLLKTKTPEEMEIINIKRSLGKGLFSKKDRFQILKVSELSEFILSALKQLYLLDNKYVVGLGLSKEVLNEISK